MKTTRFLLMISAVAVVLSSCINTEYENPVQQEFNKEFSSLLTKMRSSRIDRTRFNKIRDEEYEPFLHNYYEEKSDIEKWTGRIEKIEYVKLHPYHSTISLNCQIKCLTSARYGAFLLKVCYQAYILNLDNDPIYQEFITLAENDMVEFSGTISPLNDEYGTLKSLRYPDPVVNFNLTDIKKKDKEKRSAGKQ